MGLSIDGIACCAKNLIMAVSVPSRGNGVIDLVRPRVSSLTKQVSVPSRGNGVIDLALPAARLPLVLFPSPLGEMGLSICTTSFDYYATATGFRPLSGKWGYRFVTAMTTWAILISSSFRPLSGKWGYRFTELNALEAAITALGFRPLSGKWGYR